MKYFFNINPKHKSHNLQALNFLNNSHFKIGVMGGSFNPAHKGHLAISLYALKKYKFDYIIWLVAKQNPFKPMYEKNIFKRAEAAKRFVKYHPKIIISTAENDLQETQTYYVLKSLIGKFKTVKLGPFINTPFVLIVFPSVVDSKFTLPTTYQVSEFTNVKEP